MQRCVEFLVDELKVVSRAEAEELVFFVSAREALTIRTREKNLNSFPPGAITSYDSKSKDFLFRNIKFYFFY